MALIVEDLIHESCGCTIVFRPRALQIETSGSIRVIDLSPLHPSGLVGLNLEPFLGHAASLLADKYPTEAAQTRDVRRT